MEGRFETEVNQEFDEWIKDLPENRQSLIQDKILPAVPDTEKTWTKNLIVSGIKEYKNWWDTITWGIILGIILTILVGLIVWWLYQKK
jgi:hypothetical protein